MMSQTEKDDTFETDAETAAEMAARRATPSAQDITAALMSAEPDIELPGNARPASVISNLLALKVGDNFTKSVRLQDNVTMAQCQANMNKWKSDLRNSVNQSIRHARRADDRQYSMETTVTSTPGGTIYVQVIITRTE
jgi:hypothetical protein